MYCHLYAMSELSQHPVNRRHCHLTISWWRHQMENFSVLLALCAGNSPVPGEFPSQRPVTRSFDVFFDLRLNKWLSKQSWGWWFETPSRSLWRYCNMFDNITLWGGDQTIFVMQDDAVKLEGLKLNASLIWSSFFNTYSLCLCDQRSYIK